MGPPLDSHLQLPESGDQGAETAQRDVAVHLAEAKCRGSSDIPLRHLQGTSSNEAIASARTCALPLGRRTQTWDAGCERGGAVNPASPAPAPLTGSEELGQRHPRARSPSVVLPDTDEIPEA